MNDGTSHHPEFERLLVRAADELLDAREREILDGHLATCGSCRETLEAQRRVRTSLVARPPLDASAAFYARVTSALQTPVSWIEGLDFRRWTWRLAPVAAALVVAVVAYAGLSMRSEATAASTSDSTTVASAADLPVSSALWSSSFSDTSVLSLMLSASADDALSKHVTDNKQP